MAVVILHLNHLQAMRVSATFHYNRWCFLLFLCPSVAKWNWWSISAGLKLLALLLAILFSGGLYQWGDCVSLFKHQVSITVRYIQHMKSLSILIFSNTTGCQFIITFILLSKRQSFLFTHPSHLIYNYPLSAVGPMSNPQYPGRHTHISPCVC